jgi:hypothetical protein
MRGYFRAETLTFRHYVPRIISQFSRSASMLTGEESG